MIDCAIFDKPEDIIGFTGKVISITYNYKDEVYVVFFEEEENEEG